MIAKKNEGIEFLRLCATIGVIVNHVGVCWISYFGSTANDNAILLFKTINGLAYWPVPIFMMISGFLLLSKKEVDYSVSFKYFKKISVLLILFGTFFALMELLFQAKYISLGIFATALKNMLEGNSWKHLWYLYMLLGIYLILPMLKALITPHSRTSTVITLELLIFCFSSFLPYINCQIGIDFPIDSIYVGYFLLGYLLMNEDCQKWSEMWLTNRVCEIGIILLFALILIGIYSECKKGFSGYQCPFTVIQAILIYVLIMRNKQRLEKLANSKWFKNFNRCSLGIYILHMLWINIIIKVLHINIMDASIGIIFIMLLIIVGLSWISTAILLKIPILNRYL